MDQPAETFLSLIEYLRQKAPETPSFRPPKPPTFEDDSNHDRKHNFYLMLEPYRMSLGVYPVGVYRLESARDGLNTLVASLPTT